MSESRGRARKLICRSLDAAWMEEGPLFEVDFSLGTITEQDRIALSAAEGGADDVEAPSPEPGNQNRQEERPTLPRYESPYLTVKEAAAYCRLAVGTIYNHRREIQRMPGTSKLLFRQEDLDAWLQARRRKR